MYNTPVYRIDDRVQIEKFVLAQRAADLITIDKDGNPMSTLMPLMWQGLDSENKKYGTLVMHMARGNDQWKYITNTSRGLAIVHGPQGYVSPSNYDNKDTDKKIAPTWDYQSVHLSGTVEISEDREVLRNIVTNLWNHHESTRSQPLYADASDPAYIDSLLSEIVAIYLHIDKVEAKFKLSQNKSLHERERIIEDLHHSSITGENNVASAMKDFYN
jgi:transcriptional regulator